MSQPSSLQPADTLWRMKGLVRHWSIYLGAGAVLEIVPNSLPRVVSYEQFANGKTVHVQRANDAHRPGILQRANAVSQNSSTYHWWNDNCQHLKNYVLYGRAYSEDIDTLTVLLSILACLTLAQRMTK